ncbi:hypothetical protein HGRIS_014178 [Hohenbuehelia grisea]|uniref:Protein kinase domain-containing protein n=1 Tax=Hohenbuehelia grisea TaxID=104357 RepID=A0ABR3JU08_9AGAR
MFFASHHSSDTTDDGPRSPRLSDYDIIKELHRGNNSVVYAARCRKGRLRNRDVALKKIINSSHPQYSLQLHQSLYHPSIVTLYQTIASVVPEHHVLELCSRGTLHDYLAERMPEQARPILSESQLRGLAKNILDALVYLRKEGVVHRCISPTNILLTSDFRPKLSGFRHAVRFPLPQPLPEIFEINEFSSPEIVAAAPHTYATDAWSFGVVIGACYSGSSPFQRISKEDTFNSISRGFYQISELASLEAQDLVKGLLCVIPTRRLDPSASLQHQFFASHHAYASLGSRDLNNKENAPPSLTKRYPTKPQRLPSPRQFTPLTAHVPRKTVLSDIGNVQLRQLLQDEIHVQPRNPDVASVYGDRRVVSDPLPRNKLVSFLSGALGSPDSEMHIPARKAPERSSKSAFGPRSIHIDSTLHPDCSSPARQYDVQPPPNPHIHNASLPIGTTRPVAMDISLLNSQVHKTVQGQITITPSRSILIDFREGERRRGGIGVDKVMSVDPLSSQIKLLSASTLGSQSTLKSPEEEYSLELLPSVYWKLYNEAALVIEQIKQRTPHMVLYTPAAKCILWANGPKADIELLFRASTGSTSFLDGLSTTMRIRLSRQRRSIEIMRFIKTDDGGEWVRKEFAEEPGTGCVASSDWSKLERVEREGMACLMDFARTCEGVEALVPGQPSTSTWEASLADFGTKRHGDAGPMLAQCKEGDTSLPSKTSSPTATAVTSLSSLSLAPRPSRLPKTFRSALNNDDAEGARDPNHVGFEHSDVAPAAKDTPLAAVLNTVDILPTWFNDTSDHSVGVQTRFIPSVGWCVRYSSRVSQCGRYKIMFMDGATLDIDVDEDWAEYTSQSGEVSR